MPVMTDKIEEKEKQEAPLHTSKLTIRDVILVKETAQDVQVKSSDLMRTVEVWKRNGLSLDDVLTIFRFCQELGKL